MSGALAEASCLWVPGSDQGFDQPVALMVLRRQNNRSRSRSFVLPSSPCQSCLRHPADDQVRTCFSRPSSQVSSCYDGHFDVLVCRVRKLDHLLYFRLLFLQVDVSELDLHLDCLVEFSFGSLALEFFQCFRYSLV